MQFQDGDMLVEQQYMGNPPVLVFNSDTYGIGVYLSLQDDGNLVIYDSDVNPVWAASWYQNYDEGQRCSDLGVGC